MLFPKSIKSGHWVNDFLQAQAHPLSSKSDPEVHPTRGFSCITFNSDGISSRQDFCSLHIIPLSPSLCSWVSEQVSPCWMPFPISLKEMGFSAAPCVMGPRFLLAVAITMKQGVPSKLRVCCWQGDTALRDWLSSSWFPFLSANGYLHILWLRQFMNYML